MSEGGEPKVAYAMQYRSNPALALATLGTVSAPNGWRVARGSGSTRKTASPAKKRKRKNAQKARRKNR